MECRNILCVQNHNLVIALNEFFAENPNEKIDMKEFMKLQQIIWKQVKKEMNIII